MALDTLLSSVQTSGRETVWIEVHLGRILANLERLRLALRPFTRVMAVVKANAYGHGLVSVAKALEGRVDFLGLGSLKEAAILREQAVTTPLFLFGRLLPEQIPQAVQMGLTVTISSLEEAAEVSRSAESSSKEISCHVKVDTGMGRFGIPSAEAFGQILQIAGLPRLRLEGLYTHFPTAEQFPDAFGQKQLSGFEELIHKLRRKGLSFPLRHAANSAGALRFKSPHLNLVRPGLMLYGIYPDVSLKNEISLEPALTLKARIVFLKRLQTGESVGYGRTFVAERATVVAILPVGYAHGIPFLLSGRGEVLFKGKRCRIAGRVCMDSVMVDLGEARDVRIGEEVTFIGASDPEQISAEEIALLTGSIPYEVVTRLDPGIARHYL